MFISPSTPVSSKGRFLGFSVPPGVAPGMALVVAIMTAFILLALIGSLFLVVATTRRQADLARQGAIALNLAEAGLADAIYRLNYSAGQYPFTGTGDGPFGDSELRTGAFPRRAGLVMGADPFTDWISGGIDEGRYHVAVARGTPRRLYSFGEYRGTWRILSLELRGDIPALSYSSRVDLQDPARGIAEAFNKKAVYARSVTGTGPGGEGNITVTDETLSDTPSGSDLTMTYVPAALFGLPVPDSTGDPPAVSYPSPWPAWPGWSRPTRSPPGDDYHRFRYDDSDVETPVPGTYYNPGNDGYVSTAGFAVYPIEYESDAGRDRYRVFGGNPDGETWLFHPAVAVTQVPVSGPLEVVINPGVTGSAATVFIVEGEDTARIIVGDGAEVGALYAEGNIDIGAGAVVNGPVYSTGGTVVISAGARVLNGYVRAWGDVILGSDAEVEGQVHSRSGNITAGLDARVHGQLAAEAGTVSLSDRAWVGGDLQAGQGISAGHEVLVDGRVLARGGNVYFGNRAELGSDVRATGNFTAGNYLDTGGAIHVQGDIGIGENALVNGLLVSRNGQISLGARTDGTLAGQSTGDVRAELDIVIGAGNLVSGHVLSREGNIEIRHGNTVNQDVRAWSSAAGKGEIILGGGGSDPISIGREVAGRQKITVTGDGDVSVNTDPDESEEPLSAAFFSRGEIEIGGDGLLEVFLGPYQRAAFIVDRDEDEGDGDAVFDLRRGVNPAYDETGPGGEFHLEDEPPYQSAVIVINRNGGTSTITLGATLDATLGDHSKGRLVYVASGEDAAGEDAVITVNSGFSVHGALVSGGTVDLEGNVFYDSSPYLNPDAFGQDLYRGFTGGRRAWVPRPESWKLHETR